MPNNEPAHRTGNGTGTEQPKFEEELGALEAIVTDIDSGELSLEDAITAFERGVGLVRSLNQRLDEAERKVELLMRGAGGGLKSVPLDLAAAGTDAPARGNDPQANVKERFKTKEDDDIPF
jgi:exodeoxyribonuclease VII small subunit